MFSNALRWPCGQSPDLQRQSPCLPQLYLLNITCRMNRHFQVSLSICDQAINTARHPRCHQGARQMAAPAGASICLVYLQRLGSLCYVGRA